MKRITIFLATLLSVGAGCLFSPAMVQADWDWEFYTYWDHHFSKTGVRIFTDTNEDLDETEIEIRREGLQYVVEVNEYAGANEVFETISFNGASIGQFEVIGGPNIDTMRFVPDGGHVKAIFCGGDGNDFLDSGSWMDGEEGHDDIFGDSVMHSHAYGGTGNDLIVGCKTANGGAGNDVIHTDDRFDEATARGGDGNDWLIGYDGKDRLIGDSGNDYLIGDDGDDTLLGGNGTDFLHGGNGDDELDPGYNLFYGSPTETVIGASGADQFHTYFVFGQLQEQHDDFDWAEGDSREFHWVGNWWYATPAVTSGMTLGN